MNWAQPCAPSSHPESRFQSDRERTHGLGAIPCGQETCQQWADYPLPAYSWKGDLSLRGHVETWLHATVAPAVWIVVVALTVCELKSPDLATASLQILAATMAEWR